MRFVLSVSFVCALFVALALATSVGLAQTSVISDSLREIITDLNPSAVAVLPEPKSYLIPEIPGEPIDAIFGFPGRQIDFREPVSTNSQFSDRLSISPYQVRVASDDNPNGLPPRTDVNVMRIPASALESFRPFTITARSDGEVSLTVPPFQESDRLSITIGSFGPGTGTSVFDELILEPLPEGVTEPVLEFDIPALHFDVIEPPGEVAGAQGIISDYVDVMPIHVRFISTDDPGIIANLPPADGFVLENFELGGGVSIGLGFRSDTAVPEPMSLLLLSMGVAAMALTRPGHRTCA